MTLFIDDLDIFLSDFAVEATLAGGSTIKVLFDLNPIVALGIENAEISILAKYSDVSTLVHDSTLVIDGVTYKIKETPRDEDGISSIKLSRD